MLSDTALGADGPGAPRAPAARRRLALVALALGGFGLGLAEFLPVGLVSEIAHGLRPALYARSPARAVASAGWIITAYSLGVVVGAPVIASLTARVARHRLVAALLGALAVGAVASAAAPSFDTEVAARFAAGLGHGAYFGAAGLVAERLLGPGQRARGYAVVLSGLTAANVMGVPLVTAVGQATSWRVACVAVAGVFALSLVASLVFLPAVPAARGGSPLAELAAFRSGQVWLVAASVAIGTAGFYGTYAYLAPVVTGVARLGSSWVPWVLAVVGVGMTVGVAAGGYLADRDLRGTVVVGMLVAAAAEAALSVLAAHPAGLVAAAFVVGAACLALAPAMQSRLIGAAPEAELMGAALNQSATNVANSLGAAVGSAAVGAGLGYRSPAELSVLLTLAGAALAAWSFRTGSRSPRPSRPGGGGSGPAGDGPAAGRSAVAAAGRGR